MRRSAKVLIPATQPGAPTPVTSHGTGLESRPVTAELGGPSGRLAGRVAVVAGAGGEIGAAVATRFADEGATLVGIDRVDGVAHVASLVVADLRDEAAVVAAVGRIVEQFGRIDVLYNNAGPLDPDDHALEANALDTWHAAYSSLVLPVVLTCKHVVPVMRRQGSGSIVNTGSFLAGMGAATAQTAFSAGKAAVVQITRDLGTHLARTGIRVNSIGMGPVETPESRAMFGRLPAEALRERLGHVPMGRFATVAEIAGVAAFLASDDSAYITGSDLPAYGGIRAAYTVPG